MQSTSDGVEWQVANLERLVAIRLQREKVQEQRLQAQQRSLDDAAKLLSQTEEFGLRDQTKKARELERRETRRKRDDATRLHQAERLAAVRLQKEKRAAAFELQKEKDQVILGQALQHRLEQRRVKDQLEAVCGEKARLDSLAIVERDRELWRLQEDARAVKLLGQKRLRDESGIRAGGAYTRPVPTPPAAEPYAKKRLVRLENGRSRTRNPRGLNFDFDDEIPSFLRQEFEYMGNVSSTFPEVITPDIQMSCMKTYQGTIARASIRLPCGICGGLFQEDHTSSVPLLDKNLRHYLQITQTSPDCCAINDNLLSVCLTCSSCIANNNIPPLSAGNFVNRLFCQEYPAALRDLNTVEERFIARAHVIGAFLKLTSGAQKGISYRGGRGHYVAVKQDPSNILSILPTKRLQDHTSITVSWEKETPPSEENLARFCSVNKSKVLQALLWLCAYNPTYQSVTIDYELLNSWPQDHIPQEIRDAFITLQADPASTAQDEREGYATSLQDGLFENELDVEVENPEPGNIVSRSFFSDFHGQDPQATAALLSSLQAVLEGNSSDSTAHTPDPPLGPGNPHVSYKSVPDLPVLDSFTDPAYFTGAFPTLFPYGVGGHLGDVRGNRPRKVSLQEFAKYAMLHHSHLFSQHHNFMFYLYDLILIRQASLGNHLQVKKGYWASATADLAKLTGDELHAAAAQFQSKTKISNPVIHTLINNMRIISSFNPESYGEKIRLRNVIFGKIGRLGIPLIWFTLNPHDIGNIFVVKLAGEDLVLDDAGVRSRLLKLTLKNPSLVAQYFHTIITAFFDCFFKCLSKEAGIFGTVSSYFGVVESTTRMMLHLHGFAWLSGNFGAANLSQRLVSDSQFKDRLITYIQSIVKETIDLTLGQRFATTEPPGTATFNMPDNMTPEEFKDALSIDSNNVAAKVQMHVHSHTCTKYQRKGMKARLETQMKDNEQSGLAGNVHPTPPVEKPKSQRNLLQSCRFLFPKPLVLESIVTAEGFVRMQRNHKFVNKYNPVIASAIRCNHDVNFTPSSPKVLAAVYYMTNYVTKSQTDRGQLVLAAAVLKKAQEVAEAEAAADVGLPAPPPLDMAKFALKAYHRFTRDTEVGAPAVAHFLLDQPSFYMPERGRSITINFYWVKGAFRTALATLLDDSDPDTAAIEAEQYTEFDPEIRRPSLYENYGKRGPRLANLCFYEYASQIFVQTYSAAAGRTMCFLFEDTHPQYTTHVQVSVNSCGSLATPSLCGSFTQYRDNDNSFLPNTMRSQDEIKETLLGLFYPWHKLLLDFQKDQLQDLRACEYKNTHIWDIVVQSLPRICYTYLRTSYSYDEVRKQLIRIEKERGIEFNDYLETTDFNTYNDEDEINIDIDFTSLLPTQHHLLQAALDVRGDVDHGTSRLRVLLNPLNTGTHLYDSAMVKTWSKELHAYSEAEVPTSNSVPRLSTADQLATLVPTLILMPLSPATLPTLQAMFDATPTTDFMVSLVKSQYNLNSKQTIVIRALFDRILHPIPINTVKDQLLLYIGGVGGVGKTYLIKAFLFGLSIVERQEDVLLTASTGAAAANIGGSTYHSALAIYGSQPVRPATKLRLAHKKIFIVDEISMVGLEALVRLDERCSTIWDLNRQGSTVFGGIPIVIFLGDFNQFTPVADRAIWRRDASYNEVLQAGRAIWNRFNKVVLLTEQMRQAEDLLFQGMLERARSAALTEEDVATLNSQTVLARVARGEVPPDRAVIRVNQLREDVNLTQLEIFAKKNAQKIFLFPARHDSPNMPTIDYALLVRMMFRVGEAGKLKGPGFLAFTKGMPVMLLHNTKTTFGLVNGMTATAERAILDTDVQATWIELDDLYVLCTSPLLCLLVCPTHHHNLSFSNLPESLVPILPIEMSGEISEMSDLPFRRHQVPLTLGFAITDYKCQGSTFANLIVDLKFPTQRGLGEHKKWTSINVQLGRLRSLSGVWLRESITLADVQASPHKDLQLETLRLENVERDTIQSWTV